LIREVKGLWCVLSVVIRQVQINPKEQDYKLVANAKSALLLCEEKLSSSAWICRMCFVLKSIRSSW